MDIPGSNDNSEEHDRLNHLAFGAALGFSTDWRGDLARLLRSDAPLSWSVRDELANALEGKSSFGITLQMKGHEDLSRRIDGLKVRRAWFADGQAVTPFIRQGVNILDAFENAADALNKTSDYCKKRYYYYLHCANWLVSARAEGGRAFTTMTDEALQDVWHMSSFDQGSEKPTPPSAAKFDEIRAKRLAFFGKVFAGKSSAGLATVVFTYLCELLPPENG